MMIILGIDTGGTYTDAAIIDLNSGEILCGFKTPTTHDDLTVCIRNAMGQIPGVFRDEITAVCLSTTLATNAIVEGRGCTAGLLLIGKQPKGILPTEYVQLLPGGTDITGRLIDIVRIEEADKAILKLGSVSEVIAISAYASVRNPSLEIMLRKRTKELLDIPTVCAYEISSKLGFYERTLTTVLNAKLLPLIVSLIRAAERSLSDYRIDAPLFIVRSDGSLVNASQACERPIETILSGPAASVAGGSFLAGIRDALIMDMGGTTLDIACLREGKIQLNRSGAMVGGWKTQVCAAEVYTEGLGGDSRFYIGKDRKLAVGPERSIGFAHAGQISTSFADEADKLEPEDGTFPEGIIYEKKSIWSSGPHTLQFLREKHLPEDYRNARRISITPTDLLHAEGVCNLYDSRTADKVLGICALSVKKSKENLVNEMKELVTDRIAAGVKQAENYFFENKSVGRLEDSCVADLPIVGIGAAASSWIPGAAEKLSRKVFLPEHGEIACAVGAAVGKRIEQTVIRIRPDLQNGTFVVYANESRDEYSKLEEAESMAVKNGKNYLSKRLCAENPEYSVETEDIIMPGSEADGARLLERTIYITAQKPWMIQTEEKNEPDND